MGPTADRGLFVLFIIDNGTSTQRRTERKGREKRGRRRKEVCTGTLLNIPQDSSRDLDQEP